MIFVVCKTCKKGLRISPGDEGVMSEAESLFGMGSEYYPDRYPCFHCGPGTYAEMTSAADPHALRELEWYDVTPQEALAAMHGLGLPSERDCGPTAVETVLLSSAVKKVGVRPIRNSHRSIIDYLELEDGTRVHIGSSAYGAVVYKISKKHSYVEAV